MMWSMMPCSPAMTFCSIVGHASVHTARAMGPSMSERSYFEALTVSVATGLAASLLHHGRGRIALAHEVGHENHQSAACGSSAGALCRDGRQGIPVRENRGRRLLRDGDRVDGD